MLAGACGHTYGNHNLWQMWQPGREPISIARTPWFKAIHHHGAAQMGFMRALFESRPFQQLVPDQSLVRENSQEDPVIAVWHKDGVFAVFDASKGESFEVGLVRLDGETFRDWWFDPRQNSSQLIGEFVRQEKRRFSPPFQGRNNDWILVIDDAAAELPRLGESYSPFTPDLTK